MTPQGPAEAYVRDAYRHCERITRQQARNFAYGIALLPTDKRRALSAVYALARRIDDIGDGTLPAQDKIAALEQMRAAVDQLAGQDPVPPEDQVLFALRDAAGRFGVPVRAFGELVDGCVADVRGTSYQTFDELEYYCRCVAGSIGRLSLGVFGSRDAADAEPLADALGVALQLTNILRDIREDLGNGRIYLPAEDIEAFGCSITPGGPDGPDGRGVLDGDLAGLIRFEAERALSWYAVGMRLLPMLDRRSAACTGAMAGIYLRLLEHIKADPMAALRERMSLPAGEKAAVAATSLAGIFRRPPAGATDASRPAPMRPPSPPNATGGTS
ncbi:MAG: phytoene/squalene synthase family protein [Streptosporangiaceae bacterium]